MVDLTDNDDKGALEYPKDFQLRSQSVFLRPPDIADTQALFPLVSDSKLTEFLAWAPHEKIETTRAMVASLINEQREGRAYHWIVSDFAGNLVGLVSLIDVRRTHRTWLQNRAEVAYWIAPAFQRQGFAEQATRLMVGFAFSDLSFHKLIVYYAADNPASGRVVEKLGFRYVGIHREAFCKNAVWHHLCEYELLSSEFNQTETLENLHTTR